MVTLEVCVHCVCIYHCECVCVCVCVCVSLPLGFTERVTLRQNSHHAFNILQYKLYASCSMIANSIAT